MTKRVVSATVVVGGSRHVLDEHAGCNIIAGVAFAPRDFADDTDYERFALTSLGAHRIRPPEVRGATFHLEGTSRGASVSVHLSASDSLGGRRAEELKAALRLLGFGAAYKTLDLLIEHVLRANGASSGRLTFRDKARALGSRPRMLPSPFDAYPEYWDRLAALYIALVDARHAVTHRRGGATPAGDLEVHDDTGKKTDTLAHAEVGAFMAAVHGAAELVIGASADSRSCGILAWHLNALAARHKLAKLPADDPSAGVRGIVANLAILDSGSMRVDVKRVRETIESQEVPSTWDLELRGDGRVFVGRWEDVPDQATEYYEFTAAAPPSWLTEQV